MKIAIDAREAFSAKKAGKGQWTYGFLQELLTRNEDIAVLTDAPAMNAVVLPKGIKWHFSAVDFLRNNAVDLYVSPTSFITPCIIPRTVPVLSIVHDLIAFRSEKHDAKAMMIERLTMHRALKKSTHICTVSASTKSDLLEKFPDIDADTVTPIFAGPMKPEVALSQPDNKTILCVGTLCPRKNQKQLITAFASLPEALRKQWRLVLVGSRGWNDDCIVRHAQNTKGVEWKDYVSDEEYQSLLSTATVFAYPSLYEGFGMQVLDALQRGIPVLTSDRGSLSEVTKDAAFVVDPESESSIAKGLSALLQQVDIREQLRLKGPIQATAYSWKQTVDIFLEVAQKCV